MPPKTWLRVCWLTVAFMALLTLLPAQSLAAQGPREVTVLVGAGQDVL